VPGKDAHAVSDIVAEFFIAAQRKQMAEEFYALEVAAGRKKARKRAAPKGRARAKGKGKAKSRAKAKSSAKGKGKPKSKARAKAKAKAKRGKKVPAPIVDGAAAQGAMDSRGDSEPSVHAASTVPGSVGGNSDSSSPMETAADSAPADSTGLPGSVSRSVAPGSASGPGAAAAGEASKPRRKRKHANAFIVDEDEPIIRPDYEEERESELPEGLNLSSASSAMRIDSGQGVGLGSSMPGASSNSAQPVAAGFTASLGAESKSERKSVPVAGSAAAGDSQRSNGASTNNSSNAMDLTRDSEVVDGKALEADDSEEGNADPASEARVLTASALSDAPLDNGCEKDGKSRLAPRPYIPGMVQWHAMLVRTSFCHCPLLQATCCSFWPPNPTHHHFGWPNASSRRRATECWFSTTQPQRYLGSTRRPRREAATMSGIFRRRRQCGTHLH
jgi:hypothetical protein